MNKITIIGAALVCAGLGIGALQYFGADNGVDGKVDKVVEAPAPTVEVKQEITENTAKKDVAKDTEKVDTNQTGALKSNESVKDSSAVVENKNDKSYIYIKKSEFKLYYYNNEGKEVFSAGCALGKNPGQKEKEGDMKTPTGTFYIDEICDASYWTHDFGDGKGVIEGAYGPWFISINTDEMSKGQWGGIGIHGTHDPASIGTLASEGCIRLENSQVEVLKKLVNVGTKVVIEE